MINKGSGVTRGPRRDLAEASEEKGFEVEEKSMGEAAENSNVN
jgi:hypothetical protein